MKNNRLIDLNKSYSFVFIERDDDITLEHPLSDYYYKLSDLSINLLITLKWAKWGYFFFREISKNIEMYRNVEIFDNSIDKIVLNQFEKHILILDNKEIHSDDDFEKEMLGIYNEKFMDENTKIHFKLKINLKEFLILNHILKPELMKFNE